jgi:hypothetical protein
VCRGRGRGVMNNQESWNNSNTNRKKCIGWKGSKNSCGSFL